MKSTIAIVSKWIAASVFTLVSLSVPAVEKGPTPPKDISAAAIEQEMDAAYQDVEGISFAELLAKHRQPYLDGIDFQVSEADYYDGFVKAFGLNPTVQSTLQRIGFAVVPAPGITQSNYDNEHDEFRDVVTAAGPADVYYRVFASDLPVFISADSILHAWHRTFNKLLMDVEKNVYYDDLKELLDATMSKLDPSIPAERDALFYLSVPRKLMAVNWDALSDDQRYSEFPYEEPDETDDFVPHPKVVSEVMRYVSYVRQKNLRKVEFMGRPIHIDFSQFIPRGHYAESIRLRAYFPAMTWLGQIDLMLYNPQEKKVGAPREEAAARAVVRALAQSGTADLYQELEKFYTAVSGRSNTLSPTTLSVACEQNGSPNCTVLNDALHQAYASVAPSAYSSRVFDNLHPPITLRFFPKHFAIDAFVTARTTTPKLKPRVVGGRSMAMAEDVAFALGSDRALAYYKAEMQKPHRQNLPAALSAVRRTLDTFQPGVLDESVYNQWLAALAALSRPTVDARYPAALRTAAYHDRKLEAVLAGWAELRRDTILMIEQSVGGVGCQYPKGYVDPVPAVYLALGRAAKLMGDAFGSSAKEQFQYRLENEGPDNPGFFVFWEQTMATLATMADKELKGEPMTEAELGFLNQTVDLHLDRYDGSRRYNGWYPSLYWEGPMEAGKSKPVVTDVHTDADAASVRQIGVGHPGLMIIAIDNNGDRALYGGPVYNYYAFERPLSNRMTDAQWRKLLNKDRLPEKPAFTNAYWVNEPIPNSPQDARYQYDIRPIRPGGSKPDLLF